MSPYLLCLLAGTVSLAAGLVLTPLVRAFARRVGFVDKPDGARKAQKEAVALGGGVAVTLSAVVGIGFAILMTQGGILNALTSNIRLALFIGSALIVLLGLIDDVTAMRGRYKLLGQMLISGLLIYSGLLIEKINLFGISYDLTSVAIPLFGSLAVPFTLFWLLGAINAINLIDGIDGLAGSVGTILCLSVAAILFISGRPTDVLILLTLAGGLLGFLRYNFAPATIYLGDAGSMLVGLVIGVLAIPGSAKSALAVGLMAPLAVWSIPILDSGAAILRRKLTGRSLFAPDRGHLHHSLLTRGWSVRQASMFIALICATTCASAVLSVVWKSELIAIGTVICVVLFLISTKTFGHVEFSLVRDQLSYNSLPTAGRASEAVGRERTMRLQGSREWEKLWAAVIGLAEEHQMSRVKLSINMPAFNEVFFAKWESAQSTSDEDQQWRATLPLTLDGQAVGSLELAAIADEANRSTISQVMRSLDFLEPIEEDIRQIRERIKIEHQEVRTGRSIVIDAATMKVDTDVDTDEASGSPATTPAAPS